MIFYLYCGRGFNCLKGWRSKIHLISSLCGNPQSNFSPHKPHFTLVTFERHRSRHAPRWTHVTSPCRGNTARLVLIVACFQSSDVSRNCLVFLQAWMALAHTQPVPASLWNGWVENFCVRFSSHHIKIKGSNCWQWPGQTFRRRAFLSISTL